MGEFRRHDLAPDTVRDHACLFERRLRQQNSKFFAAVARRYVDFTQRSVQTLRDNLQRSIARGVLWVLF